MGTYVEPQFRNTYEKLSMSKSDKSAKAFVNLPKQIDDCIRAICKEIDQLKEERNRV